MASQAASIRARLVRLTKTWPVDPLRPNLSFAGAIDKNMVQRVNFETLSPEGIKYAQRAVDSLEGIRVGRESVEHPTAQSILRPKSDPEYYARIRRAVEKVSKGEKLTLTFAQRMRVFFGGKP
ncbi:hypothetical protein BCV69DRAFT_283290 [Microstroma glucosiphilum]|uniref:Uncharacterized protein n=1 Tax=Pseudomicrostroma glucosiphilum TaxID=1684307 RepID=A0A316U587_9BASI|nr:hypothetical protein BCV69DRAFT_283290 [Pseudomicrostroma glucosiphilum]PWN20412.1 hypothetical protein BCV69DRAFT_283290 [Pseudomicrostroma glucosiphilum]